MEPKPYQEEAQTFGKAMNSIAFGETMLAAVNNYKKDMLAQKKSSDNEGRDLNVEDLFDDPELLKLHSERLSKIKEEREKRAELSKVGHGTYQEITEADFLETVTKAENVVCHFFHQDFERCKIVDKHLDILARKYFDTRFIKLKAADAPFFVVKLNVKMLPAILMFKRGVAIERIVGFESLGARDDFPTEVLEDKLLEVGVVVFSKVEEEEEEMETSKIRKSLHYQKTQSDEDSDFD